MPQQPPTPGRPLKPISDKKFQLANSSRKPQYVSLTSLWHPVRNPPLTDDIGTQSELKVYLRKYCGRHYAFQSIKSFLNGGSMSWHNCSICKRYQSSKRKVPRPSKSELETYRIIESEFPEIADDGWVVESRLVKSGARCGPVDIYLIDQNVAIQVDGASHFDKTKYGKPNDKQKSVDLRFCKLASEFCHVLRLHYHDIQSLRAYVDTILTEYAKSPEENIVAFSPAFDSEGLIGRRELTDLTSAGCNVLMLD